FFFQAEDGIRDDLVTGVQTCALPIYALLKLPGAAARTAARAKALNGIAVLALNQGDYEAATKLLEECLEIRRELGDRSGIANSRSEERRVGKEGRDRRWAQE